LLDQPPNYFDFLAVFFAAFLAAFLAAFFFAMVMGSTLATLWVGESVEARSVTSVTAHVVPLSSRVGKGLDPKSAILDHHGP
jgi:hypothetical protein